MVATAFHSVAIVFRKETALPLCKNIIGHVTAFQPVTSESYRPSYTVAYVQSRRHKYSTHVCVVYPSHHKCTHIRRIELIYCQCQLFEYFMFSEAIYHSLYIIMLGLSLTWPVFKHCPFQCCNDWVVSERLLISEKKSLMKSVNPLCYARIFVCHSHLLVLRKG